MSFVLVDELAKNGVEKDRRNRVFRFAWATAIERGSTVFVLKCLILKAVEY
jgi:hypothetical protein